MGITEESCCGDLRSSLRTRLRWVCSPLRPSFVLMDCMATYVKERLALPADEQFTHPESRLCRDLFDCGQLPVTAEGHRSRVIVATHQGATSPVGVTRDGTVYELFFTGLPALGFTAADVAKLYLHRGSFETELADEDLEQDSDRWCSFTRHGQEIWQILSQWMWNLRQELSQQWQPTQMRLTVFAEAQTEASPPSAHVASAPISEPSPEAPAFGPPQWARPARVGSLGGEYFVLCQRPRTFAPE